MAETSDPVIALAGNFMTLNEAYNLIEKDIETKIRTKNIEHLDAEELRQNIRIKLWKILNSVSQKRTVLCGSLFFKYINYCISDLYRKKYSLRVKQNNRLKFVDIENVENIPDKSNKDVEYKDEVDAILKKLDSRTQLVLRYLFFEGLTQREVAKKLRISNGLVAYIVQEARNGITTCSY